MNALLKIAGAVMLAAGLSVPAMAQTTIVAPGQSTTGTYMDYMKTVYARATFAELLQVPLTSFDKEFELTPLAAESWSQSEDGLTWTFKLRDGLVWSDGEPLKASDYVFALQHAAVSGYDFAWYWDFAGGIKNWKEVTEGKADVSTLGIKATDDKTIEVTTAAINASISEFRPAARSRPVSCSAPQPLASSQPSGSSRPSVTSSRQNRKAAAALPPLSRFGSSARQRA